MKRITTLIITFFIVGTMFVSAYAITPGRWDFEAGYAYAQKVAEEMAQEQESEPEEKEPEIPQSQLDMLYQAIVEQTKSARAFWRNYWRQ